MKVYEWPSRLDAWLIRKAEDLADAINRNSNRTCYWLAAQCFIVSALCSTVRLIENLTGLSALAMLTTLSLAFSAYRAHVYARDRKNAVVTTATPLYMYIRLTIGIMSAVLMLAGVIAVLLLTADGPPKLSDYLYFIDIVVYPTGFYLLACRPKPPKYDHEKLRGVPIKM